MSSPAMKRRRDKRKLREALAPMSSRMDYYFDKKCRPIPAWRWAWLSADRRYRFVANTRGQHARVSTIWLGLDGTFEWSIHKDGPYIFETAVLRPDQDIEIVGRWKSEAEAQLAHENTVRRVLGA